MLANIGESIKLTIPKNVRNLYIFSNDDQPVKIELDCDGNTGLERLAIGQIDFGSEDQVKFGQGTFTIENLDGLASSTNLKEVYINAAKVNDISGLAGCDKLEIVELENNNITDISALADKKYLRELSLSGNNIKSVEAFNNCLRLQSLSMQGNPVGDYELIDHLPLLNW
jgi:Leucine-rich repeat (LRR) protein